VADGSNVPAASDRDLLIAWTKGDEQSYETLVARHQALVHAVCRRHCPPQVVDDATQAVFLVLARRPDQAIQSPALGAWLVRTSWLISQQARRNEATRRRIEHQAAINQAVTSGLSTTDNEVVLEALEDEIQDLPERQRIALTLQFNVGHSQAEIATQLGLQVNAVKQLIHRGIATLRDRLRRRGIAVPIASLAAMFTTAEARTAEAAPIPAIDPSSLANNYSRALTLANEFIAKSQPMMSVLVVAAIIGISILAALLSLSFARPPDATLTMSEPSAPLASFTGLPETSGTQQDPAVTAESVSVIPDFCSGWTMILDCRGTAIYSTGHLPGAIDVEAHQKTLCSILPPDHRAHIVVYGISPACKVVKYLAGQVRRLGYVNVEIYPEGVQGWLRAGGRQEISTREIPNL
jgi:RNA polymerase sigma factor (sigma-70 family)